MSVDIEHKEIFVRREPPVVIDGQTIIGAEMTHIYHEENGDFAVSVRTDESDLDLAQYHGVRIDKAMLKIMVEAAAGTK